MIQRIQTVYLLGVLILVTLCFFFPMAEFITSSGQLDTYTIHGLTKAITGKNLSEIFSFLAGIAVGATLASIFLYKKRKRQMLACYTIIFILVALNILIFIQIVQLKKELSMMVTYKLPFLFPLISAVLTFLAYRGIKKDDELVKSYDRLR